MESWHYLVVIIFVVVIVGAAVVSGRMQDQNQLIENTPKGGGEQGPQGAQGPVGPQGSPGVNGSIWWFNGGEPAPELGVNGDYYFDNSTYNIYTKTLGSWILIGNVIGPQGPQGEQGIQGETGPQGEQGIQGIQGVAGVNGTVWYSGSGAPSSELGVAGDYYLNTANGDVYKKDGSWDIIGNIMGPQGPKGDTGDTGPQGEAGVSPIVNVYEATGTSYTVTNNQVNDILIIKYKGDWTGSSSAQTITLTVAGGAVDTVGVKQAATADKLPFTLIDVYTCPNSNNVVVQVSASAGSLANCKVVVIRVRNP